MIKVWCVEDDDSIRELYGFALRDGMECRTFPTAEEFFEALKSDYPDIVLMDVMLPSVNGFDAVKIMRGDPATAHIPVIMVSARGEEYSKVKGLDLGADDYITKPFGIMELIARIKARVRSSRESGNTLLIYKDITIDDSKRLVTVGGERTDFPKKEYAILKFLVERGGNVAEREELLQSVWGGEFFGETRTLDMHVRFIRSKLKSAKIETVRGVGFKLV